MMVSNVSWSPASNAPRTIFLWLALAIIIFIAAGCRQTPNSSSAVQVEVSVEPSPALIGEATLIVTLQSAQGDPIEDAIIQVRGDMSHAGMAPEFGGDARFEDGAYHIPFEWTMSGDWILTVSVVLSSGETVEQTFEYTVE